MTDNAWRNKEGIEARSYTCGHCGNLVGSNLGYYSDRDSELRIYLCPYCSEPTYFRAGGYRSPGSRFGGRVEHLPKEIERLYEEARDCMSVSAFTSAVLDCRKLLMHVAVEQGAKEGKSFMDYVQYLADNGFVPPQGTGWVDHIRKKGNEANHEITLMDQQDAEDLISFSEMLLKFIYEFPAKVPPGQP